MVWILYNGTKNTREAVKSTLMFNVSCFFNQLKEFLSNYLLFKSSAIHFNRSSVNFLIIFIRSAYVMFLLSE